LISNLKFAVLFFLILPLLPSCDFLNDNSDISGNWNFSKGEYYSELITTSYQIAINPASEDNGCIYMNGEINMELKYINIEDEGPTTELTATNSSSPVPTKFPYIIYSLDLYDGEYEHQQLMIMRSSSSYTYYYPVSIELNFDKDSRSFENISAVFWKYDFLTGIIDSNTIITLSGSTQFQTLDIHANVPTKIEHNVPFESIREYKLELDKDGDYRYHISFLNSMLSDSSYGYWYTLDQYLILVDEESDTTKLKYNIDEDVLILAKIEYCEELETDKQAQCFHDMEEFYHIDFGSLISCKKVNKFYFHR